MSIYYAKHRRNGLETLRKWYVKPLNKLESVAVGAICGLLIGVLIFMCVFGGV